MSNSNAVVKSRKRRKLLFVERFGGKCQFCGYNKCVNALEFHHIDESTKKYSPSSVIGSKSLDVVEKELEKCILICANCHRELHYDNQSLDLSRYFKPWIVNKCNFCGKEFKTKENDSKYCSGQCFHIDRRKVLQRPSKDELKQLINEFSWTAIGKKFGVSDNAVRKWARQYNLI